MLKPGGALFSVGYWFYSRTKVGEWMHWRDLQKFHDLHPNGHSKTEVVEFGDVVIRPIAVLEDNYSYLIIDKANSLAVAVDPADPYTVMNYLEEANVPLHSVLTTHKHWDHAGGNTTLRSAHPSIKVFGSKEDGIPGCTHPVVDQQKIEVGNLSFTCMFLPGHTVGHTVYLLDGKGVRPDSVFTGDCLFLAGCGRIFEGTTALMLKSLDKLAGLKDDTLVWPGHEYAKSDLTFANHIDEKNEAVKVKLEAVRELRSKNLITSPSTIAEEKSYNPFLRTSDMSILRAVQLADDESGGAPDDSIRRQALVELRKQKDAFSYKL